ALPGPRLVQRDFSRGGAPGRGLGPGPALFELGPLSAPRSLRALGGATVESGGEGVAVAQDRTGGLGKSRLSSSAPAATRGAPELADAARQLRVRSGRRASPD